MGNRFGSSLKTSKPDKALSVWFGQMPNWLSRNQTIVDSYLVLFVLISSCADFGELPFIPPNGFLMLPSYLVWLLGFPFARGNHGLMWFSLCFTFFFYFTSFLDVFVSRALGLDIILSHNFFLFMEPRAWMYMISSSIGDCYFRTWGLVLGCICFALLHEIIAFK